MNSMLLVSQARAKSAFSEENHSPGELPGRRTVWLFVKSDPISGNCLYWGQDPVKMLRQLRLHGERYGQPLNRQRHIECPFGELYQ